MVQLFSSRNDCTVKLILFSSRIRKYCSNRNRCDGALFNGYGTRKRMVIIWSNIRLNLILRFWNQFISLFMPFLRTEIKNSFSINITANSMRCFVSPLCNSPAWRRRGCHGATQSSLGVTQNDDKYNFTYNTLLHLKIRFDFKAIFLCSAMEIKPA